MISIMKKAGVVMALATLTSAYGSAQGSWGRVYHNERLKVVTYPDRPIVRNSMYVAVEGILVPESKEPSKALVFPQQMRIECHNHGSDEKECLVIALTLVPVKGIIGIGDIDTEDWEIDTWGADGLVASYVSDVGILDKCQRHLLTIDFRSGAVSLEDIPTHGKGCEAFTETDSYRLLYGHYYVDTTPNNDWDKAAKGGKK
ncbi:MAG: hypothetical protein ACRD3T_08840 [Terriglobia bacterium]